MLKVNKIEPRGRPRSDSNPQGPLEVLLSHGPETRLEAPLETGKESVQATIGLQVGAETVSPASLWAEAPSVLKLARILFPFDFSAASVRLLRWVILMAEATGARVSVLHVVYPWPPPTGREAPYQYDPNKERLETARSLMHRLLGNACQGVDVIYTHIVLGRPIDEIIRFARSLKVDLLVMATHGERGSKHLFLSATTERATRRAPCPVLAVPEAVLLRWEAAAAGAVLTGCRRILVATDFSAASAAALRYAAVIAQEHGSEVYVLNFSDHEPRRIVSLPAARLDWGAASKNLAGERLDRWIHSILNRTENVKPLLCPGKPSVYMLLRQAALLRADLLVFGPREYAWVERLRLTSSTDAILRNAPCPVLSLRAEASGPWQ